MAIDWDRWETVTVDLSVEQRLEYGFCRDTEVGWRFCFWNRLSRKSSGDWTPVEGWDALLDGEAAPELPDAVLLSLQAKLAARRADPRRSGRGLSEAGMGRRAPGSAGFGR